jgi:hypothetical protein
MAEQLGFGLGTDRIPDDESLLRSVPAGTELTREPEFSRPPSQAFFDRNLQPSVDRRCLLSNLLDARRTPGAGIAELIALAVREIRGVGSASNPVAVDVHPDPVPGNPAHALICTTREVSESEFRRLRHALARCARMLHLPDPRAE